MTTLRRAMAMAVCCALATFSWPAQAPEDIPEIEYERYELANGLNVILHVDHSIPMVAVNVWYHVGSGNETPGRTGFAHLFEHMMFQGSKNMDDEYFTPLQKVGGAVNGSTNTDRTNYWENVPSNYLELALWMESDRMGYLLDAMTQEKLDTQIEVVRNERRQNYENTPYSKAWLLIEGMLYPDEHPYSWPTIGYHQDLEAASLEDVSEFFRSYYTPNNASLCIAGDFDPEVAKKMVEEHFGPIPPGPPVDRVTHWQPRLEGPKRAVAEDNVTLPRIYLAWHSPGYYRPGDAELDLLGDVLASGKSSRLYKTLVYDTEIAQDVSAFQRSREKGSYFVVIVTGRQGVCPDTLERETEKVIADLLANGVTEDELQQAKTVWQADFVRSLESVGGFGGVADTLNEYNVYLGDPNSFEWDFNRYAGATIDSVMASARTFIDLERRVTVRIVPQGDPVAVESGLDRSHEPEALAEPAFVPPTVQRASLDNGLEILLVENHDLPLVQANLVVKSGWAADPAGRPGAAALTAELLDEGTTSRDALEIAAETKRLAAELASFSMFDASMVTLNVLRSKLDEGLTLLADVALHPTFPEDELERQRKIYLGRIQQEAKQPTALAIKVFQNELYGADHPYGQPFSGSGTRASLEAIGREDLRDFYGANYAPNNAALILAGDITLEEARDLAAETFGGWERGVVEAARIPDATMPEETTIYLLDRPGAPQSVVVAGHLGLKRSDPNHLAAEVMNNALGGKFTSRLNLNLREDKGFTYGARTIQAALSQGGFFLAMAPVQTDSTAATVTEMIKELRDVAGPRPITAEELADARGNLVKGFPQRFQRLGGIAFQMADLVMYDLPDDEWSQYVADINAMTTEAVAGAAEDLVHADRLVIVVVGDREQVEPSLAGLGVGKVVVTDGGDLL